MDSETAFPDTGRDANSTSGNTTVGVRETPWHAAYPTPRSEAQSISRHDVLQMLKKPYGSTDTSKHARRFVLVDLRRTDYEVDKADLHSP